MNWELVAQKRYNDEGGSILIFVERLRPLIKFNTRSSVHIAVPLFNLVLYKGRDSSFNSIVFYHGCVSRNSRKFSVEYL